MRQLASLGRHANEIFGEKKTFPTKLERKFFFLFKKIFADTLEVEAEFLIGRSRDLSARVNALTARLDSSGPSFSMPSSSSHVGMLLQGGENGQVGDSTRFF